MDVRAAEQIDCAGIGEVHVQAWRSAYRGEFPDDYLDSLDPRQRAEYWGVVLEQTRDFGSRLIVAEKGGTVVGFACFGPANGVVGRGELYAMNVHPDHWRDGVGSALLNSVSDQLVEMELYDALLWTGEQNSRSQLFYFAHGWQLDGITRVEHVHGLAVAEVRLAKQLGEPCAEVRRGQ